MKKIRVAGLLVLSLITLGPSRLKAQVLITGETGGKGNQAVLFTVNGLAPEGLRLFNAYVSYGYAVSDRVGLMATYGNITALGQTQHYAGVGFNAQLLRREKSFVDISSFNVLTTPLHRRKEASTLLLNSAIVASRPITSTVTLYSGINFLIPIGSVRDELFTPPETFVNVPIGASIRLADKWYFYGEVDAGPNLKTAGIGFLRVF